MASQFNKTGNGLWSEREKATTPNQVKPVKRLKSPKKSQECKKSANHARIEDVFLNSEYFKHQSGNKSSLSFCSGDNGDSRWKVDQSKLGVATRQKLQPPAFPNDVVKNDAAVSTEKEVKGKACSEDCGFERENSVEPTEKLLEEILTGKGRTDRDLVTLVTEQMFLAERELQITRTHLVDTVSKLNERDLEIIRLHERVRLLEKTGKPETSKGDGKEPKESSSKTFEDYERLIEASEKLKKQVKDMEEFLNDYGLVWVGDKETNHKPDFDKVLKSFQRLNSVACQPKIIQTTLGARFKLPREIPLVLYSNGLLLRDEFREYDTTTTLFLQDVEDGYFPGELQTEFPDGVPFEVADKRNEVYSPGRKGQVFEGQGNRLGSALETTNPSVVYLTPVKQSKATDSATVLGHSSSHKSQIKKLQKKRSRYGTSTERTSTVDGAYYLPVSTTSSVVENASQEKTLKVKVRFGSEKTEYFVLEVAENGKMFSFQKALHRKLCEKYHNECLVDNESNIRRTDFEVHVYGKPPFRLSEHLEQNLKERGIADNCVINVTEI